MSTWHEVDWKKVEEKLLGQYKTQAENIRFQVFTAVTEWIETF
jgi:hypothetical protein